MEITKNSIGLSRSKGLRVIVAYAEHYGYQRLAIEYTWQAF